MHRKKRTMQNASCLRPPCSNPRYAAITSCVPENQLEVIFRVLPSQVVDCLFAHNRQAERPCKGWQPWQPNPNQTQSNKRCLIAFAFACPFYMNRLSQSKCTNPQHFAMRIWDRVRVRFLVRVRNPVHAFR